MPGFGREGQEIATPSSRCRRRRKGPSLRSSMSAAGALTVELPNDPCGGRDQDGTLRGRHRSPWKTARGPTMSKRKNRNESTPARLPRYEGRNNAKRKPSRKK